MKKERLSAESRNITLRLSPEEFEIIKVKLDSIGTQDVSEYLRILLFKMEMSSGYPDPSFAEFLVVAIGIKNELNAIGKNFNQAVKRLHQNYYSSAVKDSLEFYDAAQCNLLREMGEIKSILVKAYTKMSGKSEPPKESK